MSTTRTNPRRGFTLVELTMTLIVGSLVVLGVFGVFAAANTMERVFGSRFERSSELSITQRTIRRAMLSFSMQEDLTASELAASNNGVSSTGVPERSRMLLEPDPTLRELPNGWHPQRFEVVLSEPPIALNTMSNASLWARLDEQSEDSQDFSSDDASGGIMRSVFELRPDGQREKIMERLGILSEGLDEPLPQDPTKRGWTLWWRPILTSEAENLSYGGPVLKDDEGSAQEIGTRLAGAVRLARGIDSCMWRIFRADEKITQYAALHQAEIPAYIEFDILLKNGQFATWMFEMDWIISDDPITIAAQAAAEEAAADEQDDASGGGADDAQPEPPSGGPRGPRVRPQDAIRANLSEGDT